MKIMCINSTAMQKVKGRVYIYKATGDFLDLLVKAGFQVNFFHFLIEKKKSSNLANFDLLKTDVRIITVRRNSSKFFSYLRAFPAGFKLLLESDFLYLFYPNSFYPLLFVSWILKKPYGLYIRGERNVYSRVSIFFLKRAQFITTISPAFTDGIKKYNSRTFTISPMMDFSVKDIAVNRKYSSKPFFNFLFLGRVERAKGVFDLIDAVRYVFEKGHVNFQLNIVGDGPDLAKALETVKALGLLNVVEFHGPVYEKNKVASFYKEADVFILPTYHEGFPRVLYEAMIFGTPIVTTFVGTIPYLMKDGFNCYRISAGVPEEIAELLIFFIRDYKKASTVSNNGMKTIRNYMLNHDKSHNSLFNEQIKYLINEY